MFQKLKVFFMENIDTILASVATVYGEDCHPYHA